jgi:predicted GH43/DUF377 family glycosyl hydrolase
MRELCLPGRVDRVQPPLDTHCFNGGLVEAWGKIFTVYRVNQRPTLLAISELDPDDLHPLRTRLLWDFCDPVLMPEDPRVILQGRELYVMFAGVHAIDLSRATMCAGGVDADLRITWISPCWFNFAQPCEKNWTPFLHAGRLHCIYDTNPFTVLRFESGAWRQTHVREMPLHWRYGDMRGGAPPVWHRGRWYCFFHSSRVEGNSVKVYYAGCYVLDRDWNLLTIGSEPILAGSAGVASKPCWTDAGVSAVFPCGAVHRGTDWLLSYGYLDEELRIATIADVELDAALGIAPEICR